ncbi:hypothetical protein [Borrelia puertoricensis]|uniref:hypothetical protein n=1 Tax=Borrelia puertoricensis TaxID=2756107 RepID=UPI001FF17BA5|nr:hypothetical protein [Borrelia puertoricensis]UPA19117.1 hypothetical protein bpuSUM_001657 [Borrelia puertoricensis]UPA19191.1 hypothetical protein bpuSUM_001771 [Borrelia puertoricensis]
MLKIFLLLTVIINLSADRTEERKQYDIYDDAKKKLVRVKDWKTNVNNLKNIGPYFTKFTERIKSLTDKKLAYEIQDVFTTSLCKPISEDENVVPKEHIPLFEKYYKFIKALKHKNLDQAAYILYEIYDLNKMFTNIDESIKTTHYLLITYIKVKDKNQHKAVYKKLENIYDKLRQKYFSILNILDHNDIDNNFEKFMLKFIEFHKLVAHMDSNITNLMIYAYLV